MSDERGPEVTQRLNTALDGRYRIERQIGMGGMATVYLAFRVDDVARPGRGAGDAH